jgi:hypothetical protein
MPWYGQLECTLLCFRLHAHSHLLQAPRSQQNSKLYAGRGTAMQVRPPYCLYYNRNMYYITYVLYYNRNMYHNVSSTSRMHAVARPRHARPLHTPRPWRGHAGTTMPWYAQAIRPYIRPKTPSPRLGLSTPQPLFGHTYGLYRVEREGEGEVERERERERGRERERERERQRPRAIRPYIRAIHSTATPLVQSCVWPYACRGTATPRSAPTYAQAVARPCRHDHAMVRPGHTPIHTARDSFTSPRPQHPSTAIRPRHARPLHTPRPWHGHACARTHGIRPYTRLCERRVHRARGPHRPTHGCVYVYGQRPLHRRLQRPVHRARGPRTRPKTPSLRLGLTTPQPLLALSLSLRSRSLRSLRSRSLRSLCSRSIRIRSLLSRSLRSITLFVHSPPSPAQPPAPLQRQSIRSRSIRSRSAFFALWLYSYPPPPPAPRTWNSNRRPAPQRGHGGTAAAST